MNLSALVARAAAARPEHPALVFEGATLSYAALAAAVGALAARLAAAGARPGDRVALLLPNVPAFPVAFHGVLHLGAMAVPLNPALTWRELALLLEDAGARALLITPALLAGLDPLLVAKVEILLLLDEDGQPQGPPAAPPPCAALDAQTPAAILYSSGTTGEPKGVTLSHGNLVSNVATNALECGFQPEDRALLCLPLFHCYGLNVVLNSAFEAGATVVLQRRFDPEATAALIAAERVSLYFGVPTTFGALLEVASAPALASLRYCYCAAAPLPLALEQRWRARFGLIVHQAYGLTEASPCVAYNHVRAPRPGTIGEPSAGVSLRVVDPDTGRDLPPGEVGELWVRGPGVMLGYWGRPEATARALVEGWLRTGDLGRRLPDGYYQVTDRLKDMINQGGLKVYPAEVEARLYEHPDVAEAAVVGVPDEAMGERVRAYVAPRPGRALKAEDLHRFLEYRLAAYKRPSAIRVLDALPRGRTGKILRRALREAARQEVQGPRRAPAWSAAELQGWLITWLEAELPAGARPGPHTPFAELGVDSLQAVRLAEALAERLGQPVPSTITWRYATPARLAAFLASAEALEPTPAPELTEAQVEALLEAELQALGL